MGAGRCSDDGLAGVIVGTIELDKDGILDFDPRTGGLRDVVYLKRTAGEICVDIEAFVAGRGMQTYECGSPKAEERALVVKGEKNTGAILNVAGYGNCRRPVDAANTATAPVTRA